MTDTFAKGQIEPTKDIMAKIELYEEIMIVGTIVEMKWTTGDLKNTGWSPGNDILNIDIKHHPYNTVAMQPKSSHTVVQWVINLKSCTCSGTKLCFVAAL